MDENIREYHFFWQTIVTYVDTDSKWKSFHLRSVKSLTCWVLDGLATHNRFANDLGALGKWELVRSKTEWIVMDCWLQSDCIWLLIAEHLRNSMGHLNHAHLNLTADYRHENMGQGKRNSEEQDTTSRSKIWYFYGLLYLLHRSHLFIELSNAVSQGFCINAWTWAMQGERAWIWNLPKSQESCGKLPSDPEPLHFRNSS